MFFENGIVGKFDGRIIIGDLFLSGKFIVIQVNSDEFSIK